eukprot:gene7990-7722_t
MSYGLARIIRLDRRIGAAAQSFIAWLEEEGVHSMESLKLMKSSDLKSAPLRGITKRYFFEAYIGTKGKPPQLRQLPCSMCPSKGRAKRPTLVHILPGVETAPCTLCRTAEAQDALDAAK